jgi:hypothetical protein
MKRKLVVDEGDSRENQPKVESLCLFSVKDILKSKLNKSKNGRFVTISSVCNVATAALDLCKEEVSAGRVSIKLVAETCSIVSFVTKTYEKKCAGDSCGEISK